MNLENLKNNSDLDPIAPSHEGAVKIFNKATKSIRFVITSLASFGETENKDIYYKLIYDSVLMSCQAILLLFGYRVKKSTEGHHQKTLNAVAQLVGDELATEMLRLQKVRGKRNRLEYTPLDEISITELRRAKDDAINLHNYIKERLKKSRETGRDKPLI